MSSIDPQILLPGARPIREGPAPKGRVCLRLALMAALLFTPAPATAVELPDFDSAAYCERVGFIGITRSTTTFDGCVRLEVAARQALQPLWEAQPVSVREHCEIAASFSGNGSYALLKSCIAQIAAQQRLDGSPPVSN